MLTFANAEVLCSYSRERAIEDGGLVDLSRLAPSVCRQHFKFPIACTSAVWDILNRALMAEQEHNDLDGVVHDMLWRARKSGAEIDASTRLFRVIIAGAGQGSEPFAFKIICGPGDDAEPVLTILLPHED